MVDPITAGIIGGGAILGGLGSYFSGREQAKAQRDAARQQTAMYQDMVRRLEEIGLPPEQATELVLEMYDKPELLQYTPFAVDEMAMLGPSAMAGVSPTEGFRGAQLEALQRLQDIQDYGGLDPLAEAQLEQAFDEAAARERSQREALQTGFQRRGLGGAGMEMAAAQQAQQSAADRARMQALQTGALAQQRGMEALMQGAGLAGQLSREDLALATEQARAQDAIERYNTEALRRAQMANWETRKAQQFANWKAAQDIAQRNVELRNIMAERRADEPWRRYQAQVGKVTGMMGPMEGIGQAQADIARSRGAERAAGWEALGKLGTRAGEMGYDYLINKPKAEQETAEFKPNPVVLGEKQYDADLYEPWKMRRQTTGVLGA